MLFLIAWRNIWRNKSRSIIIMLSVGIGLLAGITVMALYKGMLRSRVRTVIESETAHIQIHAMNFKKDFEPSLVLKDTARLLQQILSIPGVRIAAPRTITQGMLSTATGSSGVQINGVNPKLEGSISQLNKKITEGNGFTTGKANQVIIGKKLADKMKLKLGAKLVLTFTDTGENIISSAFRVAGIYKSENAPLDEKNVYVVLNEMNVLLGIGPAFHEIAILLHHDEGLDQVLDSLKKNFPAYAVESWKEISPETELMVDTIDEYSFIILVIIMMALAFGIINTMLMAILERTKEIGMMVALGMNRMRLFILILLETLSLTLAGVPIGLLFGWLVTTYYNLHGLDLSGMGNEMLSSFGYSAIIYPEFPWERLTGVLMIVCGTALLSFLFPVYKALRLKPVDALKR